MGISILYRKSLCSEAWVLCWRAVSPVNSLLENCPPQTRIDIRYDNY
jgi:hypothetical protein